MIAIGSVGRFVKAKSQKVDYTLAHCVDVGVGVGMEELVHVGTGSVVEVGWESAAVELVDAKGCS